MNSYLESFIVFFSWKLFNNRWFLTFDTLYICTDSVLLQEDDTGADHQACYFSKKFNKQIKYSTSETSRILAIQHFEFGYAHGRFQ